MTVLFNEAKDSFDYNVFTCLIFDVSDAKISI